ncbi:SLC13 family permease [Amphiplicatus metriothermophilus]|uniref:SLC13 family permease n=1 Tax=Amphiplicatus metriothermophilus TaxID=1519374 RepID=UPI00228695DD
MFGIFVLAPAMTETVTNNAVAALLTPLVISIAESLGMDPRPLIVAVMFGASASFAMPIGYQTNTLVYAAGNYRFSDFVKIGLPMNVIAGLASSAAVYFLVGVAGS